MSCPRCGNREVALLPTSEFLCKSCGNKWPINVIKTDWANIEITKAKLYEQLINSNILECNKLLEILMKELKKEDAKRLARRILSALLDRYKYDIEMRERIKEELDKCLYS